MLVQHGENITCGRRCLSLNAWIIIPAEQRQHARSEKEDTISSQLTLLAMLHKEHPKTDAGPVLRESDLVRSVRFCHSHQSMQMNIDNTCRCVPQWIEGKVVQLRDDRVKRTVRLYPSGLKIDKVGSKNEEHRNGRPMSAPIPEDGASDSICKSNMQCPHSVGRMKKVEP